MKKSIEIYCLIDNFVKIVESKRKILVGRKSALSKTDYIFLALFKQKHGFSTTRNLYEFVQLYMQKDFPPLPSYQQLNQGIRSIFRYLMMITWLLTKMNRKKGSDKHIVDSTPLPVCNNQYRFLSKVFKGLVSSGKNLNGWFWGFKLHIIINLDMEIESIKISTGSTHDLSALEGDFIEGLRGWLVGDKGYIGEKKAAELAKKDIRLLTKLRKNMPKMPAMSVQSFLLSKRQSVESVLSNLKHRLGAVNKYARSTESFFVHVFSAIVVYSFDLMFKKDRHLIAFRL